MPEIGPEGAVVMCLVAESLCVFRCQLFTAMCELGIGIVHELGFTAFSTGNRAEANSEVFVLAIYKIIRTLYLKEALI